MIEDLGEAAKPRPVFSMFVQALVLLAIAILAMIDGLSTLSVPVVFVGTRFGGLILQAPSALRWIHFKNVGVDSFDPVFPAFAATACNA